MNLTEQSEWCSPVELRVPVRSIRGLKATNAGGRNLDIKGETQELQLTIQSLPGIFICLPGLWARWPSIVVCLYRVESCCPSTDVNLSRVRFRRPSIVAWLSRVKSCRPRNNVYLLDTVVPSLLLGCLGLNPVVPALMFIC
jgi:hypothetical protein